MLPVTQTQYQNATAISASHGIDMTSMNCEILSFEACIGRSECPARSEGARDVLRHRCGGGAVESQAGGELQREDPAERVAQLHGACHKQVTRAVTTCGLQVRDPSLVPYCHRPQPASDGLLG